MSRTLSVLAVDDELPPLDELAFLLHRCPLVGEVVAVPSANDALRHLQEHRCDAVLLDIRMPGLDGLELARVLAQFAEPPAVVFVTAHAEYAVAAFTVDAAGYLLKPVDDERLRTVLGRIVDARNESDRRSANDSWESLAVELGGRTIMVSRSDVQWVESAGDYVRLHTRAGDMLLMRIPLGLLEDHWRPHDFARIHRRYLVALRDIRELRTEGSQTVVSLGTAELPVSRRHLHELRDRLVGNGTRSRR